MGVDGKLETLRMVPVFGPTREHWQPNYSTCEERMYHTVLDACRKCGAKIVLKPKAPKARK